MIPKHTSCLEAGDFVTWLRTRNDPDADLAADLQDVWSPVLDRRRLYPTPTGRHAFWYFLDSMDLDEGDEVLVPAYNFYVMVRLILQRGLVPVFVDIEPETLTIDVDDLARKITPRSALVLVTHMFGNPADLAGVVELCQQHDLLLFEDCAHAVGTTSDGVQVGQAGDGALFSFGVEKLVNSFGGGLLALATEHAEHFALPEHAQTTLASVADTTSRAAVSALNRPSLYGLALYPARAAGDRLLPRLKGVVNPAKDNPDYRFDPSGRAPHKRFMPAMHRRQIVRLDRNIDDRRANVAAMKADLADLGGIGLLDEDRHGRSNGAYFGIYVDDHEGLTGALARSGVEANPHEFYDCSRLKQFADYASDNPAAARACDHLLRLPSYPRLSAATADLITDVIGDYLLGGRER
ncbi:MAG: aminotransferase class I/II-fold pyridoxal phosphate-dependent enzyme [Actinomycetota bacterium]